MSTLFTAIRSWFATKDPGLDNYFDTTFISGILGYMLCDRLHQVYGYWPAAISLVVVYLVCRRILYGCWFGDRK
jgi:hypothetical protein